MKRLGPELKLPKLRSRSGSGGGKGLKAPAFLTDLYQDLRDRRLLPLVVLLLVGIVAAPILLGGGSSEPEEEAPPPPVASAPDTAAKSLTVVEAHPGLRAPSKRLSGRTPNNPFTQRYTGSVREGGLPNENSTATSSTAEGGSTSVVEGGTTSGTPPPTSSAPEGTGGSSGDDDGVAGGKLYTFTVDVRLSRTELQPDGSQKMGEPSVRRGVKPPAPLPGDKAPVVTYLGVNFVKGKLRALMMVSRDVSAVFGDAECVSGTSTCELLEIEPGFPEIFEYGPNQIRYKLTVLDIEIANDGKF